MKVFYFIRHGETVWNTTRRYQGHLNSPLTENGIRMAHKVCELIANEPLPAVIRVMASPQKRAMETAEVFNQYFKIELHNDDRLREISLGSWDGLSSDEIIARFPDLQLDKNNQEWYFRSPDGETFEQAKKTGKGIPDRSGANGVTHMHPFAWTDRTNSDGSLCRCRRQKHAAFPDRPGFVLPPRRQKSRSCRTKYLE